MKGKTKIALGTLMTCLIIGNVGFAATYEKVDGRRWSQSSSREEFGFLFAHAPHNGVSDQFYFENVAVFAPSAGLFSETVPADR